MTKPAVQTPVVKQSPRDLTAGLAAQGPVNLNLEPALLYEAAIRRDEGQIVQGGAFNAITTPHTGRSPKDKFVVREAGSADEIWWGKVNQELDPERFDLLHADILSYLGQRELFVRDVFAGADPNYRIAVRFITTNAWHANFAYNMFLRPAREDLATFVPEFTVLHAPEMEADPKRHGTNSSTFITLHLSKKLVLIGGTRYAGEMKKSIFTVLNYVYPRRGILSMHCSANIGRAGDTAIFFGLSGTGKTTLSADPSRTLIGDDEHGWSNEGVFNFEGGCYAKVIRLSAQGEPEIFATTRRFGTILENVVVDPLTRRIDLDDDSITENTRACYPIHFIPNHVPNGIGGHPKNVVFLTADAFGVLPPIAKLTAEQAMYHFLAGYTAKVAGTERGVTEPQATFSACFGAPFLPIHPSNYATKLGEKIAKHKVSCWLINTGWTGGPFGKGRRIELGYTRAMISAALEGSLANVPTRRDPVFGVEIPTAVPAIRQEVLDPRSTWECGEDYDAAAAKLAGMFRENFGEFGNCVTEEVRKAAPQVCR